MQKHQTAQRATAGFFALLMAIAPGLDMAVHRKLRPDASSIGGFLYQAIGRTIPDLRTDAVSVGLLFFTALWLANRYLRRKPRQTGAGEYLLCGFLSVAMLACASIRATGSVQTLYANGFQLLKTGLYLGGMYPLFLCALRGLGELLSRHSSVTRPTLWDRRPFAFPLVLISLAWAPQVAVKYPGVLSIDTVLQIKQFEGILPRTTGHPVFGTLMYGLIYTVGRRIGNVNLAYCATMLVQVAAFLLVLSYALWLMKTRRAPRWVTILSLCLFALSPVYIGWATVLIKDSPFLIMTLLIGVLLLEFLCDAETFLRRKSRWCLVALSLTLMMLTRYNGVVIAVPVLFAFVGVMLRRRIAPRKVVCFALMGCLTFAATLGVNEGIIRGLNIQRIRFYDWLSIPFQQTARVANLYGDTLTAQEKADVNTMLVYDQIATKYNPRNADQVKWTLTAEERGQRTPERYLRVWGSQFWRYPMDYLDALLNVNSVLFDLQQNAPIYLSLSDPALDNDIYQDSFCDMSYYDSEAIRPLNAWQRALTEWYYRFSDLLVVGGFASMGFCVDGMLLMAYLAWVYRRRGAILVMLPALLTALEGLFCSVAYTRYLLPTIGSLPLWLAAYALLAPKADPAMATPREHALTTLPDVP